MKRKISKGKLERWESKNDETKSEGKRLLILGVVWQNQKLRQELMRFAG